MLAMFVRPEIWLPAQISVEKLIIILLNALTWYLATVQLGNIRTQSGII